MESTVLSSTFQNINAFMPYPISIYLTTNDPHAVARFVLYPSRRAGGPSPPDPDIVIDPDPQQENEIGTDRHVQACSYTYSLFDLPVHPLWIRSPESHQLRVLSGSFRTLLLVVPQKTYGEHRPIRQILRLLDTHLLDWHPQTRRRRMAECADGKAHVDSTNHDYRLLPRLDEIETKMDRGNRYFGAFAWDEEMGRLCFTEHGSTKLMVWDFAHTPGTGE